MADHGVCIECGQPILDDDLIHILFPSYSAIHDRCIRHNKKWREVWYKADKKQRKITDY